MKNRTFAAALATVLLVAGCAAEVSVHGVALDPEDVADVAPGQSDKADVESKLGTPSTVGTFNADVWYYMSETRAQKAFFDPKVLERKIIAITFDEQALVEDVYTYTEVDGQEIKIASRVTPTAGNELTILQQLFGNLGRFGGGEGS